MSNGESFINVNFDDAQELVSLEAGSEVEVRIVEAKLGTSKNTGGDYVMVRLDIPTEPYSKDISHVMMLPTANDDPKKANNRKLALRNFSQAFGVSFNNANLADWAGSTALAILGEEEDPEYGKRNRIKRWVVSK